MMEVFYLWLLFFNVFSLFLYYLLILFCIDLVPMMNSSGQYGQL
jgi:hypothetical protein